MKSLTLLSGDAFQSDEKYKLFAQELIKKYANLQETVFHLEDVSLEAILPQARSLPFDAEAQLFRIKQCETLKEKQVDSIAAYAEHPFEKTFIIFESEELEKSHPIVKVCEKYGEVIVFDSKQSRSQGAKFIQDKLRSLGKTISPYALERFENQMGDAPALIDSVVEQMAAYVGDQKEIDEATLGKFEENWQQTDVFQLSNAVLGRKAGESLRLFRQLTKSEGDILSLIGFFHWQLKRFWQASLLLERGASQDTVARHCRLSPKQAPYFMRQLRSLSRPFLEKSIEGLFQLDWKIKSGQTLPVPGIELWLLETTG